MWLKTRHNVTKLHKLLLPTEQYCIILLIENCSYYNGFLFNGFTVFYIL